LNLCLDLERKKIAYSIFQRLNGRMGLNAKNVMGLNIVVEESRFQGVVLNVAMMKARLSGRGLTNAIFQYLRHFI
jgi:hypothetical protein